MTILYRHWIFRLPWMKGYAGMCVGRCILFRDAEDQVDLTLLRHEMIHQEQMDRFGVGTFYVLYSWLWLKGLLAYGNCRDAYFRNPLEQEAYRRQNEVSQ